MKIFFFLVLFSFFKFKSLVTLIFFFVTFWENRVFHKRCFVMVFDGCMCG
jgi:hypothetical protein